MRRSFALAAGLALLALVPADATPASPAATATPASPAAAAAAAAAPARNLIRTDCRLTPTGVTGPAHGTAAPRIGAPSRITPPAGATAPPVGDAPCPGIRPGAAYVTTVGGCTLGYVFTGSDRNTYVATAGHCAVADQQPQGTVWKPGTGPIAGDPVTGVEFGRFVYAKHEHGKTDFGLIRLRPGVRAEAEMCHFGGPSGIATNVDFDPVALVHYGNGYGMDYTQARTSYAVHGLRRPDAVTAFGAMTPGDSGGPVNTDKGLAVGIVDELVVNGNGNLLVQRLGPSIAAAQKALALRLTLRTAPPR